MSTFKVGDRVRRVNSIISVDNLYGGEATLVSRHPGPEHQWIVAKDDGRRAIWSERYFKFVKEREVFYIRRIWQHTNSWGNWYLSNSPVSESAMFNKYQEVVAPVSSLKTFERSTNFVEVTE